MKKTTGTAVVAKAKKPRSRKKVVTTTVTTTTTETIVPVQTQTKIALAVDASGSMRGLEDDVIRMFNTTVQDIKKNDPTAELTLVYFGVTPDNTISPITGKPVAPNGVKTIFKSAGVSQFHEINRNTYTAQGNTPLYDGVAEAIANLGDDPSFSYLVYVLTDGEENASRMSDSAFAELIRQKQDTDIWTFVFNVPPGKKNAFVKKSGVRAGNVQEWEATSAGVLRATHTQSVGTNSYYQARATGQRAVRNFFMVNLAGVQPQQFDSLPDVTDQFLVKTVEKPMKIQEFVESKNLPFRMGQGFYELTKPETIQAHKEIYVMRKQGKEIKANGRLLLGLPAVGDHKVKLQNLSEYSIFVQSTSNNRNLVVGTRFLYRKF